MTRARQQTGQILGLSQRATTAALVLAIVLVLMVIATQSAQAQTYTKLHNFTGKDGAAPYGGVTIDIPGNLYGTTAGGGTSNNGTVFELKHKNSGFVFNPLYSFSGGDGAAPFARVIFGPNGTLYGTTQGGGSAGRGVVFNLKPQPRACTTALCSWVETPLYEFTGGNDGGYPSSKVTFQGGNIYGTANLGGAYMLGVVYELVPSGNSWTGTVIYSFTGGTDQASPIGGVIFDPSGNLYGTSSGYAVGGNGAAFELTPSGSNWTENTLHTFQGGSDGSEPWGGLIFDPAGNLYGTTTYLGSGLGGTAFEFMPSGSGWTYSVICEFAGTNNGGPRNDLLLDNAGNLYGTAPYVGKYGYGSVFKLTPPSGGGQWIYTSLYDFCAGGPPCSDGEIPYSDLVFDANGNLYGTATAGGANGQGVVWEITFP